MGDVGRFTQCGAGLTLRGYQREVARAVVESVINEQGLSFAVMFPRQSGKNETQAQLEAYLLLLLSESPAEIVKISPTRSPQAENAMRRLERVLAANCATRERWKKENGYIYRVGQARMYFFSGSPEANIVGATASTLLEVDEAQDVLVEKFDKDIALMAASTNATQIFWGTAWTSHTLLARELRAARRAEAEDGIRRCFVLTGQEVAAEVPAYGKYLARQVARLGRSHPLIRTQYFCEEIDGAAGMFPPERRAKMRGTHPRLRVPRRGMQYALLVDVAGEDEAALRGEAALAHPGRDLTALMVVEVSLERLEDSAVRGAVYRVVDRCQWHGTGHTRLQENLALLAEHWKARYVVVDATGVGAGLAAFLRRALPRRVIPFLFTASSKSKLGWDFLAVVESGRFRDWQPGAEGELAGVLDAPGGPESLRDYWAATGDCVREDGRAAFYRQLDACQMDVSPGPEQRMRWGVPEGRRDPLNGEPLHDDLLLSAALCAVLEEQDWALNAPALVIPGRDPLRDLDEGF